jgi:hypothetical protein
MQFLFKALYLLMKDVKLPLSINPDYVLMHLDGILAFYCKYSTASANRKPVLYIQLEKAVYPMMKSALLFIRSWLQTFNQLVLSLIPMTPVSHIKSSINNK